jgi:hypothetical protein
VVVVGVTADDRAAAIAPRSHCDDRTTGSNGEVIAVDAR